MRTSRLTYIPLATESTVHKSAATCIPNVREHGEALAILRRHVQTTKMGRREITKLAREFGITSRIDASLLVEAVLPLTKPECWKKSEAAIVDL